MGEEGWKRGKEGENGRKEKKDVREEGWEKGGRRVKTGERRKMGERKGGKKGEGE